MSTTEAIIGLTLPDPGVLGVPGSGDPVDGNVLNSNWTKVGKYAGTKTGQVAISTISNSAVEQTLASGIILPNPSAAGTAFKMSLWGNYDNAASASTITWRFYLGSQLVHTATQATPAGAFTNQAWNFEWDAVCQTSATAGTWESRVLMSSGASNGSGTFYLVTNSSVAQNVTAPNNFIKVTGQWANANAGHILRCRTSVSYWTKAV